MIYFRLFYEFMKIGLFAVGGGMAALPFLQVLSVKTGWFSNEFITEMIAISESTPGPIGINMATYVGYDVAGIWGGIIATLGTILPAVIIVSTVSGCLEKFNGNRFIDYAFHGLRPAVTGLIAAAGYDVLKISVLRVDDFWQTGRIASLVAPVYLALFTAFFFAIYKFKKHPVTYIATAAIVGIAFKL